MSTPTVKGRTITLSVVESCGLGPTVWHEVKMVERPKTQARPLKSTVITAVVEHPAHDEDVVVDGPQPVCPPMLSYLVKRIKLKRPATELIFFDGSTSPPTRVYPPLH